MTDDEKDYVQGVLEKEGLRYALFNYSDFKDEVKDKKFHKMRLALIKKIKEFESYVGIK